MPTGMVYLIQVRLTSSYILWSDILLMILAMSFASRYDFFEMKLATLEQYLDKICSQSGI